MPKIDLERAEGRYSLPKCAALIRAMSEKLSIQNPELG